MEQGIENRKPYFLHLRYFRTRIKNEQKRQKFEVIKLKYY